MSFELYIALMVILGILYFSIWRVPPLYQGAVERFSKFRETKRGYGPGYHFRVPIIDRVVTRECLVQNFAIKVDGVIPPEEYGELTFPIEIAGQVCNLSAYLEHADVDKELADQFRQYLQDFVKDPVNPPASWRDVLKLQGEKYIHWILSELRGKPFPKYQGDGVDACDGEEKGKSSEDDGYVKKHNHTPEEMGRLKKGMYKMGKCMTKGELDEKKDVIDDTIQLMKGSGNTVLQSIGFKITRINVLTPEPSPELQKLIDEQAQQIQLRAKEELTMNVEKAQRRKESFQTKTIVKQAQDYIKLGLEPKDAVIRVLQVNKHLEGLSKEIIINSLSNGTIEEMAARVMAIIREVGGGGNEKK